MKLRVSTVRCVGDWTSSVIADSGLSEISDQGRRQWDVATQDEDRGDGNDDTAAVTNTQRNHRAAQANNNCACLS